MRDVLVKAAIMLAVIVAALALVALGWGHTATTFREVPTRPSLSETVVPND